MPEYVIESSYTLAFFIEPVFYAVIMESGNVFFVWKGKAIG